MWREGRGKLRGEGSEVREGREGEGMEGGMRREGGGLG